MEQQAIKWDKEYCMNNCKEHMPFWEANNRPISQEILHYLWISTTHCSYWFLLRAVDLHSVPYYPIITTVPQRGNVKCESVSRIAWFRLPVTRE